MLDKEVDGDHHNDGAHIDKKGLASQNSGLFPIKDIDPGFQSWLILMPTIVRSGRTVGHWQKYAKTRVEKNWPEI